MFTMAAVVALSLAHLASADEASGGKQHGLQESVDGLHAAWMSGNVDGMASFFTPDAVGFGPDGNVLEAMNEEFLHRGFEMGYEAALRPSPAHIQMLGDVAIASLYETGIIRLPGDAGKLQGTWRLTTVWNKTEAGWQVANYHFSPLMPLPGPGGPPGPPGHGPEGMGMQEMMEHAHKEMGHLNERMEDMREHMDGMRERVEHLHHAMKERQGGEHGEREHGMEHKAHGGPHLFIQHTVADFGPWADAYREHGEVRAEYGSQGGMVFRNADNPLDVFVGLRWETVDGMVAFAGQPALREAMEEAGVTSDPMMFFANDGIRVYDGNDDDAKMHEGPWVSVRHSVEDFEHWKHAFDEGAGMRREHGSLGGFIFRNADDPNDLLVVLAWEGIDAARGMMGSEDLAHAMREAGVVGEAQVTFLKPAFQSDR